MAGVTAGPRKKRSLPFDPAIKLPLLIAHFVGFSVWFGGLVVSGVSLSPYPAITMATGLALLAREVYKDGVAWLAKTEGALTLLKILLLAACFLVGRCETLLLGAMIACGALGSHLPKHLKDRRILPV